MKQALYRLFFLCALALLMAPAAGFSQQPTSPTQGLATAPRVGFVDIEIVLGSSQAIRNIMTGVDAELARLSSEIDRKEREVRRLRGSLQQQGSILSEAERQRRQQEALDLMSEVEEMDLQFRRRVREAQQSTIDPLLEEVIRIIGEVGRDEGFDLIVRGEMVLYGRSTADLTPAVIQEIDNREQELRERLQDAPDPSTGNQNEGSALPLLP